MKNDFSCKPAIKSESPVEHQSPSFTNEYITTLHRDPRIEITRTHETGTQRFRATPAERTPVTPGTSLRRTLAEQYAWAIPNTAAVTELISHEPLIEIGCGNGYWASKIRAVNGDILPVDVSPPQDTWTRVHTAAHDNVPDHEYATRSLLLCWPTHNADWPVETIRSYTGETLLYIGEPCGGITGSDDMHRVIREEFGLAETTVQIPQWGTNTDKLYVFKR